MYVHVDGWMDGWTETWTDGGDELLSWKAIVLQSVNQYLLQCMSFGSNYHLEKMEKPRQLSSENPSSQSPVLLGEATTPSTTQACDPSDSLSLSLSLCLCLSLLCFSPTYPSPWTLG